MKTKNENLTSIDAIMDEEFGKPGTPEREEFRKEAYQQVLYLQNRKRYCRSGYQYVLPYH